MKSIHEMEALSSTEVRIIRSLLVKQYGPRSGFLDQLASARVEDRRLTGVGVFIDLQIANEAAPIDRIDKEISEGYRTILEAPCDLVGFTLFIRGGYLGFLEGYTFGDVKWPNEPMEHWLVLDAVDADQA